MHLGDTVTTHFPFWVITFWETTIELRKTVRKPWAAARDWLNTKSRLRAVTKRAQLTDDAKAYLAALPWDSAPVSTMWRYLGPHMTTGSQQNDLLDALSDRIMAQPDLAKRLRVKVLGLTTKIMEAAALIDPSLYQTTQAFKWIRELGDEIVHGKRSVLTLHNLGEDNKHWVSLVIDGENQTFRYGNSYGTDIPSVLLDALQWWISQHHPAPFDIKTLPITLQEPHDTSSCGFLANNCLEHFAFPNTIPLLKSSNIRAARMTAFLDTAQQVVDQVRHKPSMESEDHMLTIR